MKALLVTLTLLCCGSMVKAQLANTRWKGVIMAGNEMEIEMVFKKDTLTMIMTESNGVLETMSYTVKNDTLTVKKISGMSDCEPGEAGVLKYTIATDKLTIKPVSDPCSQRALAWPPSPFIKLKEQ